MSDVEIYRTAGFDYVRPAGREKHGITYAVIHEVDLSGVPLGERGFGT